jgi:hypothetical protein
MSAADEALSATVSLAEETVSMAEEADELTVPPREEACSVVLPMILSFMLVIAERVCWTRRSTIRGGLTLSVSASTSALRFCWVCSILPRI